MTTSINNDRTGNCITLTSDNYDTWAPRMEGYLARMKAWYTIAQTTSSPTAIDARARLNKWTLDVYQFQWREDADNAI